MTTGVGLTFSASNAPQPVASGSAPMPIGRNRSSTSSQPNVPPNSVISPAAAAGGGAVLFTPEMLQQAMLGFAGGQQGNAAGQQQVRNNFDILYGSCGLGGMGAREVPVFCRNRVVAKSRVGNVEWMVPSLSRFPSNFSKCCCLSSLIVETSVSMLYEFLAV